jgi:hypothetical protein
MAKRGKGERKIQRKTKISAHGERHIAMMGVGVEE